MESKGGTKLSVPSRIDFVADDAAILTSLKEFNADAPRFRELAWDMIRRTQYWVYDAPTNAFGPSKFVGFAGMTYDLYQQARDGKTTGARFDGFHTRAAIERALKASFEAEKALHGPLMSWAEALVGPQVFEGVAPAKWAYVHLRDAEQASVDFTKGWSDWKDLTTAAIDAVPASCGAYQVRAVNEKRRQRVIPRCFGEDPEGLLGIGESQNLRSRLNALLRCMSDREQAGHMAGWRYAFLEMGKIFPLELVQFRYRVVASKDAAYELEGELLHAYVGRHFELPPLNYKFNWSVLDKQRKSAANA